MSSPALAGPSGHWAPKPSFLEELCAHRASCLTVRPCVGDKDHQGARPLHNDTDIAVSKGQQRSNSDHSTTRLVHTCTTCLVSAALNAVTQPLHLVVPTLPIYQSGRSHRDSSLVQSRIYS